MSFIALIHLLAGIVTVAVSWPFSRMRMKGPHGRLEPAFASDGRLFGIQASGGRTMFHWGVTIIATSLIGLTLPEKLMVAYACVALLVILGGLSILVLRAVQAEQQRV